MKALLTLMMITTLWFSSSEAPKTQTLKVTVTAEQTIDCQCPKDMQVIMYDISNSVGYLPQKVTYTGPGDYVFYFQVNDNYGYRKVEVDILDANGNICDEANKYYFVDCYNHKIKIKVCD